jgi:hypothetical protein
VSNGGEDALDGIRGAQVVPVLGRRSKVRRGNSASELRVRRDHFGRIAD